MGCKKYSKDLKAQIAFDAIKGHKTIDELASELGLHANPISIWNKQLLDTAKRPAFSGERLKESQMHRGQK